MKHFGFSEKVFFFFANIGVSMVWWFFNVRQTPEEKRSVCVQHMMQISRAILAYAQDADDKLPPVRVNTSKGWADVITPHLRAPYLKDKKVFQCPSTEGLKEGTIDYFFNKRISGMPIEKISDSTATILCGDGEDDAPTWNARSQLPPDGTINENSPAQRHLGGANYACVDGHIIRSNPGGIATDADLEGRRATFAYR